MSQHTIPKTLLASFGLIAALGMSPACVPDANAFGLGGGTAGDVAAEKEIRKLYTDFVVAWNEHDVPTMAKRWAIDGDHTEPDGTTAKGIAEVAKLLKAQHAKPAGVFANTTLTLAVKSVWMISDTVALVDGTYELAGAKLPDGTAIPAREGLLTSILIREKSTWSIAASRLMIPTKLPYKKKEAAAAAN